MESEKCCTWQVHNNMPTEHDSNMLNMHMHVDVDMCAMFGCKVRDT